MKSLDSFDEIFKNKDRIMVVMAHPDDAEVFAGGTISRLTKEGKRVRVIKMTSGNKGSKQQEISAEDLSKIRIQEDKKSMQVLGVLPDDSVCFDLEDGHVENDIETIGKVAKQIRLFKPNLIITHNPEDMIIRKERGVNWVNHRDHRNTGKTVMDAAYPYSRDLLFFPEHFEDGNASPHETVEFLLVDYYAHPDVVHIDVSDFLESKINALASHVSQYSLGGVTEEVDFFTSHPSGKKIERFRYVYAD